MTTHIPKLLFAFQRRFGIQKTQAGCRAAPAFETERIVNRPPQHLVAATQADEFAAVAQMAGDGLIPALSAQPVEVGTHRLGTGQDDQIGGRQGFAGADPAEIDFGVQTQRVEVVVIRSPRVGRRDDFQFWRLFAVDRSRRDRILGIEHQAMQVRQHAQYRLASALLQPG